MPETSPILLISGPPGAGKSTVARLMVAASETPIAYIEGDTFWKFIAKSRPAASNVEARHQNGRIVVQAMVASALRFARGGYETILDFTIGPWILTGLVPKLDLTPLNYVVICPSEAVCAQRARDRAEGKLSDYAQFHDLYIAFAQAGQLESHYIRDDTADAAALCATIRAGIKTGMYHVKAD